MNLGEGIATAMGIIAAGAVIVVSILAISHAANQHGQNSRPVIHENEKVACYYEGPAQQWKCSKYDDLPKK